MKIAFTGQDKYYKHHLSEVQKQIVQTLLNDSILRGDAVTSLEKRISEFFNRSYAITVNSGTDALLVALKSLNIQNGDEVIVTAFSFVASASVILSVGAVPVFIDIDAETCLMNISEIENCISNKTKAIIAVNLFGQCLNYEELSAIAEKHNLKLIEDAAQSFGSKFLGRRSGTFGHISVFSFDYTKVLGGITTGGIVLTDDFSVYEKASKLRQHGYNPQTRDFEILGINSQMSSINASIIEYNFEKELYRIKRRNEIALRYREALSEIPEISLLRVLDYNYSNYHKFVIKTPKRDLLHKHLAHLEIETKIHYDRSLLEYSIFQNKIRVQVKHSPVAAAISKEVLSLPIYPELEDSQIDYICSAVKNFS